MLTAYDTEEFEFVQLVLSETNIPSEDIDASLRKVISLMMQEMSTQLIHRTAMVSGHCNRIFCNVDDFHFAIESLLRNLVISYIPALLDSEGDSEEVEEDDESVQTADFSSMSEEDKDETEDEMEEEETEVDDDDLPYNSFGVGEDVEFDEELTDNTMFVEGSADHKTLKYLLYVASSVLQQAQCVFDADQANTVPVVKSFRNFMARELKLSYHGNPESVFTRIGFPSLQQLMIEYHYNKLQQSELKQIAERLSSQEKLLSQEQIQSDELISTLKHLISALTNTESLAAAGLTVQSPQPRSSSSSSAHNGDSSGERASYTESSDNMKTPSLSHRDPLSIALQGMATELKSAQHKIEELEEELKYERLEKVKIVRTLTNMKSLVQSLHVLSEDIPTPVSSHRYGVVQQGKQGHDQYRHHDPSTVQYPVKTSSSSAFSSLSKPIVSKSIPCVAATSSSHAAAMAAAAAASLPYDHDLDYLNDLENLPLDHHAENHIDRLVATASENKALKKRKINEAVPDTVYLYPSEEQRRKGSSSQGAATPNLYRKMR